MGRAKKVALLGGILVLALVVGDVARQYFVNSTDVSFRQRMGELTPTFRVGDPAPEFSLPDATGKVRQLSSVVKGDTLLCFLCGCNLCRQMQINLGIMLRDIPAPPAVISVTTAPVESEAAWKRDTELPQTMLYDSKEAGKPVSKQYRGDPCPRVFRLAADRSVTWIGPSPAQLRRMDEFGEALAQNLGYRRRSGAAPEPSGTQTHP